MCQVYHYGLSQMTRGIRWTWLTSRMGCTKRLVNLLDGGSYGLRVKMYSTEKQRYFLIPGFPGWAPRSLEMVAGRVILITLVGESTII